MSDKALRIGLDVGSTTAKIVVFDDSRQMVYHRYRRHNAKIALVVGEYIRELLEMFGDAEVSLCVTGSVGMATAEQAHVPFLQEVVAATEYAREFHPAAKALIDIGGEDAKVVFFGKHGVELRMNGNCAGGTGAFIDQMTVLMGVDNARLGELSQRATRTYPMAARCGVFAKTDIQNLMARNVAEEDIAASIFHSIAVQTVTTLAHGCTYEPPILLCGGPLTFLSGLRKAFADYLQLNVHKDFIVSEHSNLIPAMGCALRAGKNVRKEGTGAGLLRLSEVLRRLDSGKAVEWHGALAPLFKSDEEHRQWAESKRKYVTPSDLLGEDAVEDVVLGVDSGSTTTKLVASRLDGTVVFSFYTMNLGNPIQAVRKGLLALKEEAEKRRALLNIRGSYSTGYGEDLIRSAYNLDGGIIETMAHFHAARRLRPEVSFILDIGGQDMKAIFVDQGAVVRMELNEACSSGCGTFLQAFASNLNYEIADFARAACTSKSPCDLGTRCTVFMNSKVKQVLREGASVADISAGLSYSVVKNCLYKVLKLHGRDEFGKEIVVQGGTMRNDAVVRAFEILTGREVARADKPELMGAYGCALHAIEHIQKEGRSIDELLSSAAYEIKELRCSGCENRCYVNRYTFAGGNRFYSGNKCERVFNNYGKQRVAGENIYPYKYDLLFSRKPLEESNRVVGIPRVLGLYEDYPFWQTLFTACGIKVVLSSESTFSGYESQLHGVMSDNICFPAKLVHSHVHELDERLAELAGQGKEARLFFPYVVYEAKEDKLTDNSYNCPVVSGYSDVVRSSMKLRLKMDSPVITFANKKLMGRQIAEYLRTWGVAKADALQALEQALAAQRDFEEGLRGRCEEILANARKDGKTVVMLAGRPYHADPLVQHKLSEMVAALGVSVISDDMVRGMVKNQRNETYLVQQWAYTNRIIKAAEWVARQPEDVHFIELTSFGCGPDAFIQDEVRDILRRHGKPFTLLKIDDVSNIGSLKLRVRSLIDSVGMRKARRQKTSLAQSASFCKADGRTILAPFFTEFLSPLLPPLLKLAGYDLQVLPMSDERSAQEGLTFANNEVCYPATLIVGDMVKAVKSGKYAPDKVAFVMTQTGGQCRATNYTALIKRALIANGCADVPLITLGVATTGTEREDDGFDFPWLKLASIVTNTLLFSDVLSKLYYPAVVREREPGVADCLKQKYLQLAISCIGQNNAKELIELAHRAAVDFDAVCNEKECARVGIVGEIFLKFNPFSHQYIGNKLIRYGVEVVPPLISPFFLQEFVNMEQQKELHLSESRMPKFVLRWLHKLIERRQEKFNQAASAFRYYRPLSSIYEDAEGAKGIVSFAAQFGEGWLLPADITAFYRDGVKNVISLQPFGCIANHVISKGVEKKLHDLYPDLNLLSLDFDSGVSEVNVTNRLLLFLDNLSA